MIVYSDGISTTYNEEYYKYLIENNGFQWNEAWRISSNVPSPISLLM